MSASGHLHSRHMPTPQILMTSPQTFPPRVILHKLDRESGDSHEDRYTPTPLDTTPSRGTHSTQRASVRARRTRADRSVPRRRAALCDRPRQRRRRTPSRACATRRARSGIRVPVEPARYRVAFPQGRDRADRRLSRRRTGAWRAVRRVGRAGARPARPRRCGPSARARLRRYLAAGRSARQHRHAHAPVPRTPPYSGARHTAVRPPGPRDASADARSDARRPTVVASSNALRGRGARSLVRVRNGRSTPVPRAARGVCDARRARSLAYRATARTRRAGDRHRGSPDLLRHLLERPPGHLPDGASSGKRATALWLRSPGRRSRLPRHSRSARLGAFGKQRRATARTQITADGALARPKATGGAPTRTRATGRAPAAPNRAPTAT